LPTIRGNVPRPGSWQPGCRFSDRCSYKTDNCDRRIALTGTTRLVRCARADELDLGAGL
jgi:peptide/nickel transport system permease protein